MSAWRLERLGDRHDVSGFRSGNDALDLWLVAHARDSQRMDSARTFVLINGDSVAGYFSLTMGSVRRSDAPRRLVRGMPAYPVGVALLARLAVHVDRQGHGVGGLLLAEALRKAVVGGEVAAARLVVVDAIDGEAERFYAHHGFVAVPENPRRLYRRMKDVRVSLDSAADGGG